MSKKHNDAIGASPPDRKKRTKTGAMEPATLKDLRKAANQTQEDLAEALGVGQDTISRLEKRSDMLLSTLRHYVESVGGRLALVAIFPNRPPVTIDLRGIEKAARQKDIRDSGTTHRNGPVPDESGG